MPLGLPGRALDVVHAAARVLVLERLLGQVPRVEARDTSPPTAAAVLGQPHPGGRDSDGKPVRISRPGADRVQAEPAAARLPMRARRLVPQSRIYLPACSAVVALEQDPGISARVQGPVGLAAGDDPDPLQRLIATSGRATPSACSHSPPGSPSV